MVNRKKQERLQSLERFRQLDATEPKDWQEPHDETVPVEVVISHQPDDKGRKRTAVRCQRRKPDARVWDRMTAEQEWAADMIMTGWRLTGGEIGCPTMRFDGSGSLRSSLRAPETERRLVWESQIVVTFKDWVRDGRRHNPYPINAMSVIDYLAGGATLAALDRQLGVRKGRAAEMIFEALNFMIAVASKNRMRHPVDSRGRITPSFG